MFPVFIPREQSFPKMGYTLGRTCSGGSNSFLHEMTPVFTCMGDNNDNDRVASLENKPIHLKKCFSFSRVSLNILITVFPRI